MQEDEAWQADVDEVETVFERALRREMVDMDYGQEATLVRRQVLPDCWQEVRVPAFPEPPSYLRVVLVVPDGRVAELLYWADVEWREEGDEGEAIGAVFGAIKQVAEGRPVWRASHVAQAGLGS